MKRAAALAVLTLAVFTGNAAAADNPGLFAASNSDWAVSWLGYIFGGNALPGGLTDDPQHLAEITKALRTALSIYSLGMLALAGLLVLYHVGAMIAETAHYGSAMGRRTNQLWTPIRFILALGLLVPVSGGLSAGQYLVVKLAEQGSSLASNAWRSAIDGMKQSFSGFAAPRSPDVQRLAASAVEMELCRAIYHQVYASLAPDVFVAVAGDMPPDARKIPALLLSPELWRYSNTLHADIPLCGEYRFMAQNWNAGAGLLPNRTDLFANDLADFTHDSADHLIIRAREMASPVSLSFLPMIGPNGVTPAPMPIAGLNIGGMLNSFTAERQTAIATKLRVAASASGQTVDHLFDGAADAGWVQAGTFVADLAELQAINGSLAADAVPGVQAPVFGHTAIVRQLLRQAIADHAALRLLTAPQLEKITLLYERTDTAMKLARQWLYGKQIPNADLLLTDPLDLQDQLSPATDLQTGFYIFNRLLDAGSVTYGVWADAPSNTPDSGLSFLHDRAANPLLAIAEFGRRYLSLGSYLFGMTGAAMDQPGTRTVACLFAIVGGLFCLGGLALTFLLPLLPLFRFFFAVLVWFLAVFEAVAALPLVALAHLNPVGDGISGATARHAYWLWLGIFMRPLLTLFGFVIGLVLLAFAMSFLNIVFIHLIDSVAVAHDGVLSGVRVTLALLYVVFAYIATNQSFKGINLLPDKALSWLGAAITAEPAGANFPAQAMPAQQALLATGGNGTRYVGGYVTRPNGGVGAAASAESATQRDGRAARDRNAGSSLFPSYSDKPVEPVSIPTGTAAQAAAEATGGASASSSSASVTAGGITAIASAIAKQLPAKEHPLSPEIIRAANALSLMAESHRVTEKSGDKPPPPVRKPGESQEQTAGTPDDENDK